MTPRAGQLRPLYAAIVGCADPARLAVRPQKTKVPGPGHPIARAMVRLYRGSRCAQCSTTIAGIAIPAVVVARFRRLQTQPWIRLPSLCTTAMTATSAANPPFRRPAIRDGETAIVVTVLNRMLAAVARRPFVACALPHSGSGSGLSCASSEYRAVCRTGRGWQQSTGQGGPGIKRRRSWHRVQ